MLQKLRENANHIRAISWSVVLVWAAILAGIWLYEMKIANTKWLDSVTTRRDE